MIIGRYCLNWNDLCNLPWKVMSWNSGTMFNCSLGDREYTFCFSDVHVWHWDGRCVCSDWWNFSGGLTPDLDVCCWCNVQKERVLDLCLSPPSVNSMSTFGLRAATAPHCTSRHHPSSIITMAPITGQYTQVTYIYNQYQYPFDCWIMHKTYWVASCK